MTHLWLLNPGPVNTTETVRRAGLDVDLCHREPEAMALMTRVREKLLRVAGVSDAQYTPTLIAGSGTAALELGVSSLVRSGGKMLVVRNGVYGDRIARIAEVHGIPAVHADFAWTERPKLDVLEAMLQRDPAIEVVALVHHETTTGLLNPVAEVGALAKRYGKLFFIDSISAFGGEELSLIDANVDVLACTANKCLHGLPGVAFLFVSNAAERHVAEVPVRSLYFDLKNYLRHQRANDTPFTPCVPALFTLDRALDELLEEGPSARRATYRARAAYLRSELAKLGFDLYLDPTLLSNSITTFRLPSGVSYPELHDALKRDGFVIYAGQGKLASEIFRIANMGAVPMSAYEGFVRAMKRYLDGLGTVLTRRLVGRGDGPD